MTKLWIDNLRTPPPGWLWVKTSHEAIVALSVMDVQEVSFDYDLGGGDTTLRVILWLCEQQERYGRTYLFPAVCRVHADNPGDRDWIASALNRYGPGVTRGPAQAYAKTPRSRVLAGAH